MKAQDVINKNRKSFEELKQMHLDYINSNGEQGSACLNYEHFLTNYYNLTDKQIIEQVLSRGIEIEDAEEFLANEEKKEKAN